MDTILNALLNALILSRSEFSPLVIAALHVAMVGAVLSAALPARADQKEHETPFLVGADCSHVGFFEAHGKVYKENGVAVDPFHLLKEDGVNCVRLRLFTGSDDYAKQDSYNTINNLTYTVPLAVRVKQAGLPLLLDFHYSDTWADPGKQVKPSAWKDLTFDQLEERLYAYNRDCIAAFKKAGAMPDYVQVGNEITPGMLWPEGRVGGKSDTPEQWAKLGRLLKAAIRGIKAAAGTEPPKLIIHIDRGGDWKATQWYFDHLREQNVEFDIIGESYYPFWHGSLKDLQSCLTNAAMRYQKPVIVAETAFPWNNSRGDKAIVGILPGKEGQVEFLQQLAAILKAVPNGKGLGIFYWAAEFQPLDGTNLAKFEGSSFFDETGNALPVLKAFGQLAHTPEKPEKAP
jgi:arabinogalactan endo-1,4-beta-galactosidase